MRSRWMMVVVLSAYSISLIAAEAPNRRDDDDPKTAAAIRELVRRGAVVKRFTVIEANTAAGLLVRLKSEHLDQLGQIRPEILTELSSLDDLALELRGQPLSDAGLKLLLKRLKLIGLDVSGSKVTDRGLLDLPSQRANLRMLDVSFTKVSDAGLKPITELDELRYLSLMDCRVTDDGSEALARLRRVREIYLSKADVSAQAVERLRRSLPTCRIER